MDKKESIKFFDGIYDYLDNLLINYGFNGHFNRYILFFILFCLLGVSVFIIHYIVRYIVRGVIEQMVKKTKISLFKYLRERRFPHYVAFIAPVAFVLGFIPLLFKGFPTFQVPAYKLVKVYSVFMVIWIIMSLIKSFFDILREKPAFKYKPMSSWSQVINIILIIVGCMFSYMIITGNNIATFIGVLGATSAVLLLIFKDTIMGFVASITVTTNDMVRLGDWITMPEYNADGDVVEINLNTVKIQNFDKTITTIPTYKLIQNSFQNWRGMQNSGGRRIKRSINIIQSTVRFVKDEELKEFSKIQGISEYILEKNNEIKNYNLENNANKNILLNGRNFTNLGLFRKYTQSYLEKHQNIDQTKTLLVRQLSPTAKGIPIEVYAFTKTIIWAEYEGIQSDIFDHLIAAVKYFDLSIFEDLHNQTKKSPIKNMEDLN